MDNKTKYLCFECDSDFDENSHECSICGSDACKLVILCESCNAWYVEQEVCSIGCELWKN